MENESSVTSYKHENFVVKNITYMQLSELLDTVIDLYLDILGTDEEDIIEAFTSIGYTVTQAED